MSSWSWYQRYANGWLEDPDWQGTMVIPAKRSFVVAFQSANRRMTTVALKQQGKVVRVFKQAVGRKETTPRLENSLNL